MFALGTAPCPSAPSPSPQPNAADVILSGASRHPFLSEIALRFSVGTRRRRIPLRFCPASSITKAAVARNIAKFPKMRTYENCEPNAFKISTSKTHDLNSRGIKTCRETDPRETSRSGFRTPVESIGLHVPEMSFRRKKSSFAALTKSTPLLAHNKVATNFRRAASAASEFMRRRMNTCELQNISSLECALAKKHQGGGVFCYRATSRAGKVAASLGRSVKSSRMRTWGKGTGCGRL